MLLPRCRASQHRSKGTLAFSWALALLLGMLLGGCVDPRSEANREAENLLQHRIQLSDLPSGWFRGQVGVGDQNTEAEGVISRWAEFRGSRDQTIPAIVWQEVTKYPGVDQAMRAYARSVEERTPTADWTWPRQIQFESQADSFSLVCLDLEAVFGEKERTGESHWCTAVSRHDAIVSVLTANIFTEQFLTFPDFQGLLVAADARLISQP